MKILTTILLTIGGLMLLAGHLGMGPLDIEESAIGLMIFAGVLHLIWGRQSVKPE